LSEWSPVTPVPVEQHVLDGVRDYLDEHDIITVYTGEHAGDMIYTIGLTNAGLPELALIGVPAAIGNWLDRVARQAAEGEVEIGPSMTVTDRDGHQHIVWLAPHDPAVDPDPTLSRCLFGDDLDLRVLNLWSCACPRCADAGDGRGLFGLPRAPRA
jgi:hypothetical protein